jgi:hypothetical protein
MENEKAGAAGKQNNQNEQTMRTEAVGPLLPDLRVGYR